MIAPNHHSSATDEQLRRKRESIRRGLARANLTAAAIISLVVALAIAALYEGFRAERNARRAEEATERSRRDLLSAYTSQATARRQSRSTGFRKQGLEAVAAAARIEPSEELRSEAIALLAATDLTEEKFWPAPKHMGVEIDGAVERFVTREAGGRARVFRFSDNAEVATLQGPAADAAYATFSPDGELLAVRYANDEVWVWNLGSGEAQGKIKLAATRGEGSFAVAFTPDSRWLAVGELIQNRVRLWDARTGAEGRGFKTGPAEAVVFHPREALMAVVSRGRSEVEIFNYETGTLAETKKHTGNITSARWSPDGTFFAAAGTAGEVFTWSGGDAPSWGVRGHSTFAVVAGFTPDGAMLATRSWDGRTRLWDSATGQLALNTASGYAMEISPDGWRLGFLRENAGVGYWELHRPAVVRAVRAPGANVRNMALLAERYVLAANGALHLRRLDTRGPAEFWPKQLPPSTGVMVAADQSGLLSSAGDGLYRASIAREGEGLKFGAPELVVKAEKLPEMFLTDATEDLSWAVLRNAWDLQVVDARAGKVVRSIRDDASLAGVGLSADGKLLAVSRHGKATVIYDVASGAVVKEFEVTGARVGFSRDGKWFGVSSAAAFEVFEVGSWTRHCSVERAAGTGQSPMFAMAGGLAAVPETEQVVKLLELPSGKLLARLRAAHSGVNENVAFSADGEQLLVSSTADVMVWDLPKLKSQLAALGLSWEGAPAVAVASVGGAARGGLSSVMLATLVGVLGAIGLALVVFARHRRLVHSYADVEAVAEERSRELAVAQGQVLHSQKMKALGTLAAGIAHDFNNLLSVVRISNDLIEEVDGRPEIRENTAEIEKAVQQGKSIVQSMLGYSREAASAPEEYSVGRVIENLVTMLSRQFLGGIEVRVNVAEGLENVMGHRTHVEQILLNLVINASESMKGAGRLEILAGRFDGARNGFVLKPASAGEQIEIAVADTGQGISPEILPRIFEPFFTTKHFGADRGTGLGLSLVYSLAERNGFGLAVDSRVGAGAVFTLIVPVKPEKL